MERWWCVVMFGGRVFVWRHGDGGTRSCCISRFLWGVGGWLSGVGEGMVVIFRLWVCGDVVKIW